MQIKTRTFITTFILLSATIFSQTKVRTANKTIKDSIFNKGDIIKIPELIYQLSHPMGTETIDSLQPVAEFLKKNPTLKVEISCHTDSRGRDTLNIILSDFRAKHVRDYLINEKGIAANRLTFKGYGESAPIISAKEILKAKTSREKEKLYSINRRTELKVLEAE